MSMLRFNQKCLGLARPASAMAPSSGGRRSPKRTRCGRAAFIVRRATMVFAASPNPEADVTSGIVARSRPLFIPTLMVNHPHKSFINFLLHSNPILHHATAGPQAFATVRYTYIHLYTEIFDTPIH